MKPFYADDSLSIYQGDCRTVLAQMPAESVQCVVTSPPYWGLRDYQVEGQIGLEATPNAYVDNLAAVFREVKRVLRKDGVCWLNLGDSYAMSTIGSSKTGKNASSKGTHITNRRWSIPEGLKPKDLVGIPWRVAFALQADGWYLRSDIIWSKPNCMPESVTDRPTRSHEYIFLLTKSERYYYNADAIKEPAVNGDPMSPRGSRAHANKPNAGLRKQDSIGKDRYTGFNDRYEPVEYRNKRSVWTVAFQAYSGAHYAVFPEALIEPCILAGSKPGDIVLDPFAGSGTTGRVALRHGRQAVLIDLNGDYIQQQLDRTQTGPILQALEAI